MANQPEKARVGDAVMYFQNGVTSFPWLALVTDSYSPDLVALAVFENGRFVAKGSVHRKDCPAIKNSPQIAANFGCWEYRDPPEVRHAIAELAELVHGAPEQHKAKDSRDAKSTAKV